MNAIRFLSCVFVACLLGLGCSGSPEIRDQAAQSSESQTPTLANALLQKALVAHGWAGVTAPAFRFKFRDRTYTYASFGANWRYSRELVRGDSTIRDELYNGAFSRTVNGRRTEVADTTQTKYTNSLNSVIYFATLPQKLTDRAVNLHHDGTQTVGGNNYGLLRVHFDEAGGGKDHDDNFLYWINEATGTIDYLAYDYRVDGGGVRFRSAYNPRAISGVIIQDYVNYFAPIGTSLNDLSALYEAGELKELSRIILEDAAPIHVNWR